MPEINLRWSFLAVLCLVVAAALVLSRTLDARPRILIPFTRIASTEAIGTELASEISHAKSRIRGIGYPQLDRETEIIVSKALEGLPASTHIIVGGNLKVSQSHDSVDLLNPEALDQMIAQSPIDSPIVVVLPSIFISHRMGKNWLTEFEHSVREEVSSFILSRIALKPAAEEALSPKCYTSQRTVDAQTYDLGCIILAVSRNAQAARLDPNSFWLSVEAEMPREILLSYSVPDAQNEQ